MYKIFALFFALNTFAQLIVCAPTAAPASSTKSTPLSVTQLNPEYMRAIAAYRRLEQRLSRKDLRALTTIGILNGARMAEQQMEEHLVAVIKDLLQHTDVENVGNIMPKIDEIERQLLRDQRALQILTSALDLATSTKDVRAFKQEMRLTMREVSAEQKAATLMAAEASSADSAEFAPRIAALRQQIIKQVETMKTLVDEKITKTLAYLIEEAGEHDLLAKARHKVVRKRNAAMKRIDRTNNLDEPGELRIIKSILSEADFRQNLIDEHFEKRSDNQNDDNNNHNNNNKNKDNNNDNDNNDDIFDVEFNNITAVNRGRQQQKNKNRKNNNTINNSNKHKNNNNNMNKNKNATTLSQAARQVLAMDVDVAEVAEAAAEAAAQMDDDEGSAEFGDNDAGPPAGGGGLVGIISGLSGGEGGSDIGALIGALTGVISTLFGPGGLDIESLISTATSLISGLLSGNKNFGTVLGQYVGTAFDGLSGGGGAINNGQFLGNFLGTVIASLSADPEDEAGPQPLLFAQTLLSTFLEAKNRKTSGEASEERKGSAELLPKQRKAAVSGGGGSDSGSFVKQIVAHIVSNVVSLVLNASVGASGGASHASGALLSGSSSASHTQTGGHHGGKAWT